MAAIDLLSGEGKFRGKVLVGIFYVNGRYCGGRVLAVRRMGMVVSR